MSSTNSPSTHSRTVVASAPGRCGILGNPTDGYVGSVISCSLAERAVVTVSDSAITTITIGDESTRFTERADYELKQDRFDCARAVLNFLRLREQPVAI